ncbi:MAG TPA: DUF2157 domain-containing protein [Bryobacteraceae bacterium]|nr:DUF2157 domain-containing protein [Bryobacteraceae bacterium]
MAKPLGRREAQQRADRLRIFRAELDELERQQVLVLTDEQRARLEPFLDKSLEQLAAQYDIDTTESQKQLSLGMRIVSALGGLALCAAVFLFFYRFWGSIPTAGQIAILIATPLIGLAAMHFVSQRERTLCFTGLIALVVFASFVLNLYVLGQIFNIISSPNAFLPWGALAIALAYTYGLRLLLAAGLVCWLVFVPATIVSWTGVTWQSFFSRPECMLASGLLIIAAQAAIPHRKREDFPGTYRLIGLLALYWPLLALWHSGSNSFVPLGATAIERTYQVLAFVAAALTIWFGIRKNLPGTMNLGAAAFTLFLFIKFVDWWWDLMPKYIFFFIVGAIAIGLLIAFRKLREATA